MTELEERLIADLKTAMKAGNKAAVETLRMLRAQIKDVRIDKREELNENDVVQVISTAAKRRKESIKLFEEGRREDLVRKEQKELEIILAYLPEQLSQDKLKEIIGQKIEELNVSSEKDVGLVMKAIMPEVKGKADGKVIQQMARELLTQIKQ
jgi:uncharacterized protein YqeY